MLWEDYRDGLSENLRDMKFNQVVLFPRLQISEDEIRDLYNRRVQALGSQGRRQLQGILLRASGSETPDGRRAALRASRLAALARDESWEQALEAAPDSLYASSGGEIGVFSAGELHEQMEATAFSLKKGEVSEPISLPAGLLILRLADIVASDLPDLELMRPDLENERGWVWRPRRRSGAAGSQAGHSRGEAGAPHAMRPPLLVLLATPGVWTRDLRQGAPSADAERAGGG